MLEGRAGERYAYAHDSPDGLVAGPYMGVDKEFYRPTGRGYEAAIAEYLKKARAAHRGDKPAEQA